MDLCQNPADHNNLKCVRCWDKEIMVTSAVSKLCLHILTVLPRKIVFL